MRMVQHEFVMTPPVAFDSATGVLFRRALALIRNKRGWCQGVARIDAQPAQALPNWMLMNRVKPMPARRAKYCTIGALSEAAGSSDDDGYWQIMDAFSIAVPGMWSIAEYNDTHTHREVIALWNKVGRANGWLH